MNKIATWNDRFSEAKRSFSFGILQYLYDCNLQIHSIFRQIFSPKIKGHSILAVAFHLIIYMPKHNYQSYFLYFSACS